MPDAPVGIGIVGAGDISARYFSAIGAWESLAVRGVAGRGQVQTLLDDPTVDLVLNLTPPLEHAAVTAAALRAGKHVYSEKPLAHDLSAADELIALAQRLGRTLSCAPATHLGPAQQAVAHAIGSGSLGRLVGGSASFVYGGPDLWHHNPAPIFGAAAGPLFDLGVYAVSAFVHWFGNARRVCAVGQRMHDTRRAQAGPRLGQNFAVQTPTHVTGWIEFERGPVLTITTSFDTPGSRASAMEVMGTDASLAIPAGSDGFSAMPLCCRKHGEWTPLEPTLTGWADAWWAVGVIDAADAIRHVREPRCSSGVARHVLEVLCALQASCDSGQSVSITSRCSPPPALRPGLMADNFPALLKSFNPATKGATSP